VNNQTTACTATHWISTYIDISPKHCATLRLLAYISSFVKQIHTPSSSWKATTPLLCSSLGSTPYFCISSVGFSQLLLLLLLPDDILLIRSFFLRNFYRDTSYRALLLQEDIIFEKNQFSYIILYRLDDNNTYRR
jgi:hypothetical protein